MNFEKEYILIFENLPKTIKSNFLFTKEYEQYILESRNNFSTYSQIYDEINNYNKNDDINVLITKDKPNFKVHVVNNSNSNVLLNKKKLLKNIVEKQKKMYNNFIHHYKIIYDIDLINIEDIKSETDTSSLKSTRSSFQSKRDTVDYKEKTKFKGSFKIKRNDSNISDTHSDSTSQKQKKKFFIFK